MNCEWEAVQGAWRGGSEERLLGLSAVASSSGLGEGGWRGGSSLPPVSGTAPHPILAGL